MTPTAVGAPCLDEDQPLNVCIPSEYNDNTAKTVPEEFSKNGRDEAHIL